MTILRVEHTYVSSSCNRTSNSVDCSPSGLICYASCNNVLIYDYSVQCGGSGKVIQVLTRHTKRVNSVQWVKGDTPNLQLVSVSCDQTAILWTQNDDGLFHESLILSDHLDNVTIVDALYLKPCNPTSTSLSGKTVVLTASNDSKIKLWTIGPSFDAKCQTIDLKNSLCLSASLTCLPGTSKILVAFATDDCKINLYTSLTESDETTFLASEVLTGHEDWVQSLDFTIDRYGDLILASGSQDSTVRLWRFSQKKEDKNFDPNELRVEEKVIKVNNETAFVITAESVLSGHEGWIYGVHWKRTTEEKEKSDSKLQLLTSSMDKTLIVWEQDESSGIWLEAVRLGEVGGNTLGFRGGKFGPDGSFILAHSYHGAFHVWRNSEEGKVWSPGVIIGGHFDEVTDVEWDPKGAYLLSISQDQTTRLHAPWISKSSGKSQALWYEIARPQVHGYNLSCIAVISRNKFASGAEEKVVRSFQAPTNFLKNFKALAGVDIQEGVDDGDVIMLNPLGASVPALGLSNKAVYQDEETKPNSEPGKNEYPEAYFLPLDLKQPPTEEDLVQNTLWPETQKLYGHGFEIFSLAASSDGTLLASACKATSAEHAAIILWDTKSWKRIETLVSHTLTITDLKFSPNNLYLLSVSRDRDWSLFRRCKSDTSDVYFELFAKTGGKKGIHTRIIWCCSWSHDNKLFCTGSRDSKAVVWTVTEKMQEEVASLSENVSSVLNLKDESVTSCSMAPGFVKNSSAENSYLIALGCESGSIHLCLWSEVGKWSILQTLTKSDAHTLTVKRLSFRPVFGQAGENSDLRSDIVQLASAGSDHFVRVFTIYLRA